MRLFSAIKAFFRVLFDGQFRERLEAAATESEPTSWDPEAVAVLLSLFQREGRLLDFLQEDIDAFQDAQVGAAARSVHAGCRKILQERIRLIPIREEAEGTSVTVEEGFDPSALRLSGRVTGDPPFRGLLRHHGWRVSQLDLPRRPDGHDRSVVQVAEVEIP